MTNDQTSDTVIHNETTCVILNDSFKYNFVLASGRGEDGFFVTKGFKLIVDSSYINFIKSLKTEEIIKLLKSEKSDFATHVSLLKIYTNYIPYYLIKSDSNTIENWHKTLNKKHLINYWRKELFEHNHDSLREVYLNKKTTNQKK